MTNHRPYFIAFGILAALVLIFFGVQECKRKTEAEPVPAEATRQRVVNTDSIEHSAFQKRDAYWKGRIKADSIERITATFKDKLATEKARQSANTYAKTGKHEDCTTALTDCKEENATKAYALDVQERMLTEYDSLSKLQGHEIGRSRSVIDTLSRGWAEANRKLAKEKGKRWGIGVHAGYGAGAKGLSPYVGAGINYQLIKF
jgi:opacity protein-like surface antigen